MKESKRMKEDDKKVKGCKRMRRINLDDKYIVIIVWGEEGQPQQFLVRATFFSFSHPSHLYILVARISKNIFICKGWPLKKYYWKHEDFELTRTRKWGECGSNKILVWLASLPSLYSCILVYTCIPLN